MRAIVPIVLLVLVACTSTAPPVARITPTAYASVSPPPAGSPTPSENPPPAIHLTPLGQSLSCRLPVTWLSQQGQTYTTTAGFISFPSSALVPDPFAPTTAVFYDRAFLKWLPIDRTKVSPDGKRYAYGSGDLDRRTGGQVHVVDVATAVDTVILESGSTIYQVIDFAPEGIYLVGAWWDRSGLGLWLEDPAGGTPRLISSTVVAPAVGGGAAWGLDFNPADPHPALGGLVGPYNRLLRVDLRTGASTPWFYRPGAFIDIMGFDSAGNPLVRADFSDPRTASEVRPPSQDSTEVWLIKSPTVATRLSVTARSDWKVPVPSRVGAVDRHGVWIGSIPAIPSGSVWLYVGSTMQLVATVDASDLSVAGGCIP